MDIITQGFLGAALAQTVAKKDETRKATVVGFVAGLLADADILIRSSSDPLLTIEYHRHFSHSIFFIPIGALLAAILLWPFMRKRLVFKRLYLYSLLGFSLSGFIDACTSYGTYLFWPLLDERIAFHIIPIIEPVFTLALIIGVVLAYRRYKPRPAVLALLFAGAYLLLGTAQMYRGEAVIEKLASERGHVPQRLIVKPTIGNMLLWRSVYEHEGRLYVDAVRLGLTEEKLYEGESVALFVPGRDAAALPVDSVMYGDILRFRKFSDNYLGIHPERPNIIGDIRYAIRPDSVSPLWGIEVDFDQPGKHAGYRVFRSMSRANRGYFWSMLKGEAAQIPQN